MATVKKEVEFRIYKVLDDRNFNGFVHPTTRKFITEKDGVIKVASNDVKAIEILKTASDVTDVTDIIK